MVKSKLILLLALLIFLFLPSLSNAQTEQEFNFNRDIGPTECALPGVNLSLNTKIYAIGAYSGTNLDWQIDDSGHQATLFKVVANSPKEPVVLVLSAYEPSIWHISWTKGTQIAAVVVSGYHTQKIAGLPENVPVLNSTYENKGACKYFYESYRASEATKQLFGREVDKISPVIKGQAVLGEALTNDTKLITEAELRKEDFHDPNKPLAGEAGLAEAVQKGLLKKATSEDMQQYLEAVAKGGGLPDHLITGNLGGGGFHNSYVVLSPDFIIPAGLYGGNSATFILPEGIPQPKGPVGHCDFKSYAEAKSQTKPVKKISNACSIPEFQIPANLKVYAAGAYSGSKLNIQIDESGHEATLMQITANSPKEPVALLLGAYEPTIWHINWTKDSKISAVIVSGNHTQIVTGLPKDIPVLNNHSNTPTQCPSFSVSSNLGDLLTINGLSNHLFKKDVDQLYNIQNGKILIGNPLTEEAELETAEEFHVEKFIDPNKPLAGEAGLAEAVSKGLLKKATSEDMQQYLAAVAKGGGLPDHLITGNLGGGGFHNSYVVLSPDFIIPAGLYGGNSATFILPEGIPQPKGPVGHCDFKSYAEAKSQTKPVRKISNACSIPEFQIPANLKVYFAGANSGSKLNIQIDDSGHEATLMQIMANSPQEPVALFLGAYKPTIWHISWTKDSKISAVIVSGNHTQIITGLPKDIPILNSSNNTPNQCPSFYYASNVGDLLTINGLSNHLFKKDIDQLYHGQNGKILIGKQLTKDTKLETAELFHVEKFIDNNWPLAGAAGLAEAVSKGLIKQATSEDIQQYLAAVAKSGGLPEHIATGELSSGDGAFHNGYVVLSPDFIIPSGLYGAHSATFILPEGIPQPKGSVGHCRFKSYAEAKSQTKPISRISSACSIPEFQIPANLKVYAAGAYSGSKLNIQIDESGHEATLMKIMANSPQEPVALFLGAYEPTIWHISWTKNTKISAVIVSGSHTQIVTGLPEDIPLINSRNNTQNQCPSFYYSSNVGNLLTINGLSNHLFKKDIDQLYNIQNGKILIGNPLTKEAELETAEEFKVEKFIDTNKPLAGAAGLAEAVSKGLIKKANDSDDDDYKKWLVQYAKRQNIATDKIDDEIKSGSISFQYPPFNAYLILSPDFVMPAGLHGANSADFIVPENIELPQGGSESHAVFYLLKDGTCVGRHPGCISH